MSNDDVLPIQRPIIRSDANHELSAFLKRAQLIARQSSDRLRRLWSAVPKLLAKTSKVSLTAEPHQRVPGRQPLDPLDVELGLEQRSEGLQPGQTCPGRPRHNAYQARQRESRLDLCGLPSGVRQRGQPPDVGHSALQRVVDGVSPPSAGRRTPEWTDVPISSRCNQSVTKGMIGASSRLVTVSTSWSVANAARRIGRLHVVKPGPRQAHVPLGDIVVDELPDRARRQRRLVSLQVLICLALDVRETGQDPSVEGRPLVR